MDFQRDELRADSKVELREGMTVVKLASDSVMKSAAMMGWNSVDDKELWLVD
jgi:hypothetical protein